jgi:CubicO group peptidase (beta-lactamase class C family)
VHEARCRESTEPLLEQAQATHSDAVVVRHMGQEVGVWRFGKPRELIPIMSVTKSMVNLAIGKLFTLGLIPSLDEPMCTYYPQWKQGQKKLVTLRHIMTHTSGLQNVASTIEEIYPSPDFIQLALCAELTSEPGKKMSYNNKAVNLLVGIVEICAGRKLDVFMSEEIFLPLGITDFEWQKDPAGNPQVMAGLALYPEDLATLGQLVLNRGLWQNTRLIESTWFDQSFMPTSSHVGLLWWLSPDQSYIQSNGYLGQYLVLFPEPELVFVRMISYDSIHDENQDSFSEFIKMAQHVAKLL